MLLVIRLCRALLGSDRAPAALAAAQQALACFADYLPLIALLARAQAILGLHEPVRDLAVAIGDDISAPNLNDQEQAKS